MSLPVQLHLLPERFARPAPYLRDTKAHSAPPAPPFLSGCLHLKRSSHQSGARALKLEDWLENGHQHSWGLWLLPSASERRGVPAAAMSLPAEPCPATHPQHTPCRAGGGGHGDKDRAPGGRHGACSVTSSLSFSQKPGLQGPEIVCGLHPPLAYRSLRLSPRTTPHRVGGDRNCAFSPYPLALPEKQE